MKSPTSYSPPGETGKTRPAVVDAAPDPITHWCVTGCGRYAMPRSVRCEECQPITHCECGEPALPGEEDCAQCYAYWSDYRRKQAEREATEARWDRIRFEFANGILAYRYSANGAFVVADDISGVFPPHSALLYIHTKSGRRVEVSDPAFVADLRAEFGLTLESEVTR